MENIKENIKHFIIIRFYCLDMMKREKIFDYNLLHTNIDVFKNFCLAALENQTSKNFEIILMIHDELNNEKILEELNTIKSTIQINIIRYSQIKQFILDKSKKCDYVITTRMDHDDLIFNNAILNIQNSVNPLLSSQLYYFKNGATMINNDINNCYEFIHPSIIAICPTLIINTTLSNNIINIYQLGSHTKILDNYNNFRNIKTSKIICDNTNLSWVYVKHITNHSTLMHPNLQWHRSNIKIHKPKEWFNIQFGI